MISTIDAFLTQTTMCKKIIRRSNVKEETPMRNKSSLQKSKHKMIKPLNNFE